MWLSILGIQPSVKLVSQQERGRLDHAVRPELRQQLAQVLGRGIDRNHLFTERASSLNQPTAVLSGPPGHWPPSQSSINHRQLYTKHSGSSVSRVASVDCFHELPGEPWREHTSQLHPQSVRCQYVLDAVRRMPGSVRKAKVPDWGRRLFPTVFDASVLEELR